MKKALVIVSTIGLFATTLVFMTSRYFDFSETYEVEDIDRGYASSIIYAYPPEPEWTLNPHAGVENQPEIVGESAILVDINSGDILYEKNSTQKKEIASLVKILTSVIALEHKEIDAKFTVSEEAASIGENSMALEAGEVFSLEQLLYGLILNSGNDAAFTIAENVGGGVDTFVLWMNIKAKELNLKDTIVYDPSGLNDFTRSTAVDLAKLTRYALKNPILKEIVRTVEIEFPYTEEHKYVYLRNQTNLLSTYPGVQGVKTGYTEDAGLCLVTYFANQEVEFVGVVLNSTDRKGDMILMLDHGLSILGLTVEHNLLE